MVMNERPLVSLIVVAYNAAQDLPALLADIRAQDYPAAALEVVLVDSASGDGTRALMQAFAESALCAVQVLESPGRTLPRGCNVALAACRGELVVRVDAHAGIPPDFISKNVAAIQAGHDIVGGYVAAAPGRGAWETVLAALDSSRFAGGAAAFRNPGTERDVDTLAYAMYKKSAYDAVGRYDERLTRTEDNDMSQRMRAAGYRFHYVPGIVSTHTARRTLAGQLKQKWQNGRWVGLSMVIAPRAFALRHFVPALFVLALLLAGLLAALGCTWPLLGLGAAYGAGVALFTAIGAARTPQGKALVALCLPWLFPLVHLAYGVGTLVGLCGARALAALPSGR